MSWESSSRRRLCTNEECHRTRPTCLSTHSFRMQPHNLCSKAHGNTIISVLPRYWRHSSQRLLRQSLNSWRITTPRQVSPSKPSTIGITRGKKLSSVQRMSKRLSISVRDLRCSRHCQKHLSALDEK